MCNLLKRVILLLVILSIAYQYANQQECFIQAVFGTRRQLKPKPSNINTNVSANAVSPNENISTNTSIEHLETSNHLPSAVCDCTNFAVKKIINPYKNAITTFTPPKTSTSACLRCSICLEVADQINKTLRSICIGKMDPQVEIKKVESALQLLCQNNRNHYRYNTKNYRECSSMAQNIGCRMDENQLLKLPKERRRYIEHINVSSLYKNMWKKSFNIENYLCRGDGIFRDCINVSTDKCKGLP